MAGSGSGWSNSWGGGETYQEDAGNFGEAGIMTFVKDNKIWLIKDVSVIPKSKREFFWKRFMIGCIIGIGVTLLVLFY